MIYAYITKDSTINTYKIFGERHSGTKYLEKNIHKVYGIKYNTNYGHKHFFGFYNHNRIVKDNNTLFIGIIRNPYDWIGAMNNEPHHVPIHLKPLFSNLDKEFYSIDEYYKSNAVRPYTSGYKTEILEDRNIFDINKRYSSILELRNTKNQYLYKTFPMYANNYVLTSYEFLTNNISEFYSMISSKFNLNIKNNNYESLLPKKYVLPTKVKQYINKSLNWNIENMLGYQIQH